MLSNNSDKIWPTVTNCRYPKSRYQQNTGLSILTEKSTGLVFRPGSVLRYIIGGIVLGMDS